VRVCVHVRVCVTQSLECTVKAAKVRMMEANNRWFTRSNEASQEKGPYETVVMRRAREEGTLSAKTLVRREGEARWLPLADQPLLDDGAAAKAAYAPPAAPTESSEPPENRTSNGARCPECGGPFAAKQRKNFLGFPKRTCVLCQHAVVQQLTTTYRVIYWVVAVWVGVWTLIIAAAVSHGARVVQPGSLVQAIVFGGVSAYALMRDRDLRRVAAREREARIDAQR
jgi:hypothetical protein